MTTDQRDQTFGMCQGSALFGPCTQSKDGTGPVLLTPSNVTGRKADCVVQPKSRPDIVA